MCRTFNIFYILLSIIISTTVHAEMFVCFDAQDNFLTKREGDCLTLGICSSYNNTGLNPDCIIATQEEYDIASRFTEFDPNVVTGSRVVAMQQSEIDAINASDALAAQLSLRQGEKAQYDIIHLKALVILTMDELNTLRDWTVDFKSAVAGASTLAQLKTAVAALPTLNDRTLQQLRTALENKVDELTP